MQECFELLDLTQSAKVGREEMKFGMVVAGFIVDDEAVDDIWKDVDRDRNGGIDFAEFLEFVLDLRARLGGDGAGAPAHPMHSRRPLSLARLYSEQQSSKGSSSVKAVALGLASSGKFGTGSSNNPYFGARHKVDEPEALEEGEEVGGEEGGEEEKEGKREEDEEREREGEESEARGESKDGRSSRHAAKQPAAVSAEQQQQQSAIQSTYDDALHAYKRAQVTSTQGGTFLVTLKPVLKRDWPQAGRAAPHTTHGHDASLASAGPGGSEPQAVLAAPTSPFSPPPPSAAPGTPSTPLTPTVAKYVEYKGPHYPEGPFARPGGQPFPIPVPPRAEAPPEQAPAPKGLLARVRDGLFGWIGREERERRERETRERAERERQQEEERLVEELAAVKVVRQLVVGV